MTATSTEDKHVCLRTFVQKPTWH